MRTTSSARPAIVEQLEIGLRIVARRRGLDGGVALALSGVAVFAMSEELVERHGWLACAVFAVSARARALEHRVERERVGRRASGRARGSGWIGRVLFR